jgi:two-component system chemotaxis response regulator CheY
MAKNILLVDDDVDVLETTQFLLLRGGHNVITAKDGEEAVLKYKASTPHIVLLDIRMPKLDGYEAFLRIKKFDPDAKVVFMSAYSLSNEQIANAKKNGLVSIVEKPVDIEELKKIIDKA